MWFAVAFTPASAGDAPGAARGHGEVPTAEPQHREASRSHCRSQATSLELINPPPGSLLSKILLYVMWHLRAIAGNWSGIFLVSCFQYKFAADLVMLLSG